MLRGHPQPVIVVRGYEPPIPVLVRANICCRDPWEHSSDPMVVVPNQFGRELVEDDWREVICPLFWRFVGQVARDPLPV